MPSHPATSPALEFLEWDVTAVAHHLLRGRLERAFVIGAGGGRDVLSALRFGARRVYAAGIRYSR